MFFVLINCTGLSDEHLLSLLLIVYLDLAPFVRPFNIIYFVPLFPFLNVLCPQFPNFLVVPSLIWRIGLGYLECLLHIIQLIGAPVWNLIYLWQYISGLSQVTTVTAS